MEVLRDTILGHFLRVITRDRVLQVTEDRDPSVWQRYAVKEKSGNLGHGGNAQPEQGEAEQKAEEAGGNVASPPSHLNREASTRNSADTKVDSQEDAPDNGSSGGQAQDKAEKGRDGAIVTWYSDDDPENPQNWPLGKKIFVAGLICFLTFSVYIGAAIYSAGTEGIVQKFGVSEVAATLGLTLFVAGYGLGPMIWAPMSEIPFFGRTSIYIGTLIVFVFFQFAVIYARNFGMLLAFRFLTGFFGSPVLATGGASMGDIFSPKKRAYAITIWGMAAICGPVLGPLVGGFAAQHKGWNWPILELLWLSGFALIVMIIFLPETSSANILYRRALRLRKLTGRDDLKSEAELQSEEMTAKDLALMVLVRPFSLNFLEPIVFLLNIYISLIYGILFIWFESFAIVFEGIYKFNLGEEGLAFLGILCGAFVAAPFLCLYIYYYQERQFTDEGDIQPEKRLHPACVGSFFIPICLFWFGWTSRESIHWIVPIIGSSFFTVGALLLFNSVLNYLGDAYPTYAASVFAGNDFMRSSFGAGFPLFATAMYHRLGVDWASSLLGFLAILFIPIPFVLLKYGERIRMRSKRARHDI